MQNQIREHCETRKAYVSDLNSWLNEPPKKTLSVQELKAKGNAHVGANEWENAIDTYTNGLSFSCDAELRRSILCNRSLCYLKTGKPSDCIKDCCSSNAIRPTVKAWFRKGQAELKLKLWESCRSSMAECLSLITECTDDAKLIQEQVNCMLSVIRSEQSKCAQEQTRQARYRICNVIPKWCANSEREKLKPVHVSIARNALEQNIVPNISNAHSCKVYEKYLPRSIRMFNA